MSGDGSGENLNEVGVMGGVTMKSWAVGVAKGRWMEKKNMYIK